METHPDWNPSVSNSHLLDSISGVVDHVRTSKLTNNRFISVFRSNNPSIASDVPGEGDAKAIFGIKWTYSTAAGDYSGPNSYLNEYSNSRGTPFQISSFTGRDMLTPEVAGFSDGGYVVVWVSPGGDGSSDAVLMKIHD